MDPMGYECYDIPWHVDWFITILKLANQNPYVPWVVWNIPWRAPK